MNRAITVGALHPVIDRIFDFGALPEALTYYREGSYFGRVIVSH